MSISKNNRSREKLCYWKGKTHFTNCSKIENLLNSVESRLQGRLIAGWTWLGPACSFAKYLLKDSLVPGTVLNVRDATVSTAPTLSNKMSLEQFTMMGGHVRDLLNLRGQQR